MPPAAGAGPKAGFAIPASAVVNADDVGDGSAAQLLKAARDVVEDALGPEAAARFDRAESPRDRGGILGEAALAQTLGPETYDAVRNMAPRLRAMVFEGFATLQAEGIVQNDGKFAEGLERAFTKKKSSGTNPDGTPGPVRTALFVPLSILEAELEQAEKLDMTEGGKAARDTVKNRVLHALVLAGREEAGQKMADTDDVVFERPGGKNVRITDDGRRISE